MKISLLVKSLITIFCFFYWMRWDIPYGTTYSRIMQDYEQFQNDGMPTERAMDPWGNDYRKISLSGDERTFSYLFSCGPDGESATFGHDPDDIAEWTRADVWMESFFPFRLCTHLMTFFAGSSLTLAVLMALKRRNHMSAKKSLHPTADNATV